jgi:hypothetical protein
VFLVGDACSEGSALRGVSMVKWTALARSRIIPFTSWMNFFPALPSKGESSSGFAC